ncbi:hypothetical protein [uncultured Aliiroseovarius sp.]|uniref:hypothetical protein n=1 Tax=uncultured Aliiroseovarius sp. TaxID=1658783 RepID=UPI0026174D22|nr:hypothetical protein [uncultured Aliiroseovarius sp.]
MTGDQIIVAELNLRPQDRFTNPKKYPLAREYDTHYCSFKVDAPKRSGVYWILLDGAVVYIGRAKSLHNRLSIQYGTVSPRHPYKGGQLQKCRTNAKINKALGAGRSVVFRWEACEDYEDREKRMLEDPEMRPPWNLRS